MLMASKPVRGKPLQLMALSVPFSNHHDMIGVYVDESIMKDMDCRLNFFGQCTAFGVSVCVLPIQGQATGSSSGVGWMSSP